MYQGESSLLLLEGIVESCYDLHFASYNLALEPIYPTGDDPVYHMLLSIDKTLPSLRELCEQQDAPVIIGSPLELLWIAEGEMQNGSLYRIHIAGPVFLGSASVDMLKEKLERLQLSMQSIWRILEKLDKLPIFSVSRMTKVGQIMHYCITGQPISFDGFRHLGYTQQDVELSSFSQEDIHTHAVNRIKEKRLMELFRTGTLNYSEQLDQLGFQSAPGAMSSMESLRSIKDTVISGITLYSRAAMDGGLPPEIGYTLAGVYIQRLEDAKSFSDVVAVNGMAMNDFITRVNRYRSQENVSHAIKSCCEYIHMHVENDLSLSSLAEHFGYSSYYLSRKFKAEMNVSIQEYISRTRIEHAKLLLESSQADVQNISERLHFCNPSYFANIFRKYTGISPAVYRDQVKEKES